MKMNKKKITKAIGIFGVATFLITGTAFAATTMLKWTGGQTISTGNKYIVDATQKIISLQEELDRLISSGGGSSEEIKELEKTIVLLNEEVAKANTAAESQKSQLIWAKQQLEHAGITGITIDIQQ